MPLAALTMVNAAAAAAFALALTAVLTHPGDPAALAGVIAAVALRAATALAASRLASRHARRVIAAVRRDAIAHVLRRSRDSALSVGEAAGVVMEDVEGLDGYYGQFEPAALDARLGPFAILVAVALASPICALVLVATLIPFIAVMALAGGAAAAQADRQFEALSRLSGLFVDRVRALPVVLAFQAEAAQTAKVATAAGEVSERTLAVLRIAFLSTAALEFFSALAVAMVAVYCGFSLMGLLPFKVPETLTFSHAFFALALAPEFYAPMRRLAAAYHEKQLGEAAAARLRPLLDTPPPKDAPPKDAPSAAHAPAPAIRFEDVRLCVGDVAIGPIRAEAPAGGLTALVGPTGSGKSTLLAAILGRVPVESGTLTLVDATGQEIVGRPVAAWAGQSPAFLPGTLLENLLAASPGISEGQALDMARAVGLTRALEARALGADTVLDERGSGLSGGERRRLALARALLRQAPLLLLDEPTADLDATAEAEVIALIRREAGGRTVVIATHSDAMAAACDVIVRLS